VTPVEKQGMSARLSHYLMRLPHIEEYQWHYHRKLHLFVWRKQLWYLEMTVTSENGIHYEIKTSINSSAVSYDSV
jgi:hypothetical protein